jgi:hypothetical protein
MEAAGAAAAANTAAAAAAAAATAEVVSEAGGSFKPPLHAHTCTTCRTCVCGSHVNHARDHAYGKSKKQAYTINSYKSLGYRHAFY